MKKKTMIITISAIAVVAAVAIGIITATNKAETPAPAVEETPNTTDAVELIDEKTDFEVEEVTEEESTEKANAGSEDVGLETPEDAEYENQLRAEEGLEKTYITMYATADADVKKEMDNASETVTTVKKGTAVQVAGTENGWLDVKVNTNTGYMEESLLAKTLEETKATQTAQTPTQQTETPALPQAPEMEAVQTPETPAAPTAPTTPTPQPTTPATGNVTPEEQALIDAGILGAPGTINTAPAENLTAPSQEETKKALEALGKNWEDIQVY